VFISATDRQTSRPENDDSSDLGSTPAWVHVGAWVTPLSLLIPALAAVTRQMRSFDAVIASGPGPIFAQFGRRPWSFFVTGGDLTVKPFPITFRSWYPSFGHRAAEVVAGFWQRRAIRRADEIWMPPFRPLTDAAERLSIPACGIMSTRIPIALDTDTWSPEAHLSESAIHFASQAVEDAQFVIFHPSRMAINAEPNLVRAGQWKGNDRLFEAVSLLRERQRDLRVRLLMIDSPDSRDLPLAKGIIESLGIDGLVRWLKPPNGSALDQDHMRALYAASDVVVDEFGVGWFGFVALEGLAMAKPVLGYVDETAMSRLYPEARTHPFVSSREPVQIANNLERLWLDPHERERIGAEGRQWVVEHHGLAAAADAIRTAVADLIGRTPCSPPPARARRVRRGLRRERLHEEG